MPSDPTGGSGGNPGSDTYGGVPGGIPAPSPPEEGTGEGTGSQGSQESSNPPPQEETNTQNNFDDPPAAGDATGHTGPPPEGSETDGGMTDSSSDESTLPLEVQPTYSYNTWHDHIQKTGFVPFIRSCDTWEFIGKEKVTYINGCLFWPITSAWPVSAATAFNSPGLERIDIIRGHTGTFWVHKPGGTFSQFGFDMNIGPPLQFAWSSPMAKEGVKSQISYSNYGGPKKPEHIIFEFASSVPNDGKLVIIPGYRVLVAPSDNLNYIDNLVDDLAFDPGVGGTYGISTVSAMLKLSSYYQNLLKNKGTLFPQWQDEGAIVTLGDLGAYEYPGDGPAPAPTTIQLDPIDDLGYWLPYERIATYGFRKNGIQLPAGPFSGASIGMPYNRETIILKTNKGDIIIPAPPGGAVGQFTKEERFNGSAFLRQIEKINKDYDLYQAATEQGDINFNAPWLKNDHVVNCTTATNTKDENTLNKHYVTVESGYNFYVPEYENVISDNDYLIEESLLPNLSCVGAEEFNGFAYAVPGAPGLVLGFEYKGGDSEGPEIIDSNSPNAKLRGNIHDHLTLTGRIEQMFVDSIKTKMLDKDFNDASDNTGKEVDKGQYFVKWAKAMQVVALSVPAAVEDIRRMREQFRSQIILPDLLNKDLQVMPLSFLPPNESGANPGDQQKLHYPEGSSHPGEVFKNSKDPLGFKDRKRMFPAYVHLKIGSGAKSKNLKLLKMLLRYSLDVALLRAIQERTDDLVFGNGDVGSTFAFWEENSYDSGTGDWDSFSTEIDGEKYSYIDYQANSISANTDTLGNDLMFYRNPFPEALTNSPVTELTPSKSSRSWAHWFFVEGQDAYEALPNEDEYPGPARNIIAASDESIQNSILMTHSDPMDGETSDPQTALRATRMTYFVDELNSLLREKTRTFEEIMNGSLACEEILFWRIEKNKIKNDGSMEPIQNFYLINDYSKNEIDFVDTQVKYAGKYVYKIYAWKAIFGTETGYTFPESYWSTWKGGSTGIPAMGQGEVEEFLIDFADPNSLPADQSVGSDTDPNTMINSINYDDVAAAGVTSLLDEPTVSIEANQRWQLILNALSFPSVRIIETPFYETAPQIILDRPPLPPEVEVYPYKNVDDTMLIRLTSATGEVKKMFPQAIFTEDASKFYLNMMSEYPNSKELGGTFGSALLAAASGIEDPAVLDMAIGQASAQSTLQDYATNPKYQEWYGAPLAGAITFKSDDPPAAFEVFMLGPDPETGTPRPPNSYIDFQKAERITLPIDFGTSTALRPNIESNKKYYFTFRSIDIHGNISYPSKIYQIELVNDSGAVYLVTDIYDFPIRKKTMKKPVRKFLNIAPANHQHDWQNKAPESISSYVNYTPVLGDVFEGENNKRYKFRLTSKKSGKKLDINVKVKLTKRNTEEEKTS